MQRTDARRRRRDIADPRSPGRRRLRPCRRPIPDGRTGEGRAHGRGRARAAGHPAGVLEPVTEVARATLQQLRKARPNVITVEVGVDLTFEQDFPVGLLHDLAEPLDDHGLGQPASRARASA
ncbi:CU044_2847 family protein [Streptomyces wedmorensis]|uniref:CU044_2847 family protein n=1 Tax=Streptomyces wedmorensis TaxID=43759 RepID=UPI00342D2CAB